MKRRHPDGIAIEAEQIIKNSNGSLGDTTSSESIDHLFITMVRSINSSAHFCFLFSFHLTIQIRFLLQCFYARLGFVQPPTCLKCAHRKSTKKRNERNANNSGTSCNNLVPWRRDANKPLHPEGLGDNLVFVTCETAKSLIKGDAYPSIQWDNKNRRILHEM